VIAQIAMVVAAALVGVVVIAAVGAAWLALFPWLPRDLGGAPNLDRHARRVKIPLEDGDALDGWLLPGSRRAVVLVLHGYGRDHHRAWRYGSFLNTAGYAVATMDFRSSRAFHSGRRKPTTLGHYELPDAAAALRWIASEPSLAGCAVGVLGESLGGSVALLAAAADSRVAALVVDGAFATGLHALEDSSERWARMPRQPTASIARSLGRALTGYDPGVVDAVIAATLLRERPILFIHGLEDNRLSEAQARLLWEAAGAKDPLWEIPGVGHNEGWLRCRQDYEARVLAFLDRHLDPGSGTGAAAPERAPAREERA
jgi:fermentation-respiration switch protein FrsA (DUF1100 family)